LPPVHSWSGSYDYTVWRRVSLGRTTNPKLRDANRGLNHFSFAFSPSSSSVGNSAECFPVISCLLSLADLSHRVLREECIPASSRRAHADRFKRRPDICAAPAGSTDEPRLQEGERTVPALKLGEMAHLRVPQMLQGRHRELLLVIYSHREEPQRCSHTCFAQRQYRFFLQAVGSVLRQVRLA
jgi:hypothetical protein